MKRFKPGDAIAEDYIQKRFRDKKTGDIILKLKSDNQYYYKLTDSGTFHYTIDKFAYPENELELISEVKIEKPEQLSDYLKPYLKKSFFLKDNEGIHLYGENYYPIGTITEPSSNQNKSKPAAKPQKDIIDLEIDDVFPDNYRESCSQSGDGYSYKIGNVLFVLNNKFMITEKMTLSSIVPNDDITMVSKVKRHAPRPAGDQTIIAPIRVRDRSAKISRSISKTVSAPEVVNMMTLKFKQLLKKHGIIADYFIHEKLEPKNIKSLLKVYRGNLRELNDETRKGLKNQTAKKFKGGLSLLKAGLIHELYINSTLAGRNYGEVDGAETGKNMKNLINSIILLTENGSLRKSKVKLTADKQKDLILFFGKLRQKYNYKKKIILRIYQKMMFDFDNGAFSKESGEVSFEWFKSLLIYKIYENTNRLERGFGTTMICLSRDIMDIEEN